MKKLYLLIFLISFVSLNAQTTVPYAQRVANYDAFFSDGGGNFDDGTEQFGMWANIGGTAKQSVAWRNFTEDGTTTGTPSTMAVGDSFTITVSATRAYVQIGIALLSSPTATTTWADRINNYAVQVNLDGNSGAFDLPWRVISTGGTIDASAIFGLTTFADYKFKFTLDTATTMTVSINDGDFSVSNVVLNNQDITGYSIYFSDDWNGATNENISWKPVTEYTYAIPLNTKEFESNSSIFAFPNPAQDSFTLNTNVKELNIYDITGKLVLFKRIIRKGESINISNFNKGIYIMNVENDLGRISTSKLIKL